MSANYLYVVYPTEDKVSHIVWQGSVIVSRASLFPCGFWLFRWRGSSSYRGRRQTRVGSVCSRSEKINRICFSFDPSLSFLFQEPLESIKLIEVWFLCAKRSSFRSLEFGNKRKETCKDDGKMRDTRVDRLHPAWHSILGQIQRREIFSPERLMSSKRSWSSSLRVSVSLFSSLWCLCEIYFIARGMFVLLSEKVDVVVIFLHEICESERFLNDVRTHRLLTKDTPSPLCPCILKPDLKDSLGQIGLLSESLQFLGVWIVIDGKVLFHLSQLMMFERGPHSLGSSSLFIRSCKGRGSWGCWSIGRNVHS
jgi:hypothetical protein